MADQANLARLLTPDQVAEQLQITLKRLTQWRNRGEGPKFLRMPAGVVRYTIADVERWEQSIKEGQAKVSPALLPVSMRPAPVLRRTSTPPPANLPDLRRKRRFGGYKTKADKRAEAVGLQLKNGKVGA